jgi:hypothetical protein
MRQDGTFPPGTPFYSLRKQEISFFFDGHGVIAMSVAALALLAESSPINEEPEQTDRREAHPRSRCPDHAEYVRRFAIPSYTDDMAQRL